MNISKISSSSNSQTVSDSQDSVVNALQQRKEELTNQLSEVKNSKADSKTKSDKIKNLTSQIAEIDQQIIQAKAEAQQRKLEEAQQKAAEIAQKNQEEQNAANETNPAAVLSTSLNQLLSANNNTKDAKILHSVQQKLNGEIAVTQSEIKNSHRSGAIQSQMNTFSNNTEKLTALASRIAQNISTSQKNVQNAIKLGIDAAEKKQGNSGQKLQENSNDISNTTNTDSATTPESQQTETPRKAGTDPTLIDVLI